MKLWSWLKKLFKKQEPKPNPIKEYNRAVGEFHEAAKNLTGKVIDIGLDTLAERAERYSPFQPLPASTTGHRQIYEAWAAASLLSEKRQSESET